MKKLLLLIVCASFVDVAFAERYQGDLKAMLTSCNGTRLETVSLPSFDVAKATVHAGNAVPLSHQLYLRLYWSLDEARAERRGNWRCARPTTPFADAAYTTGVPVELLAAIAMNESGRVGRPWPWTLNVAGRPIYFRTRQQAHRTALALLSKGMYDFDIGIMQISWKHNGWRFRNAWDALQPSINIATAGHILAENFEKSGSWRKSVAWYHTRDRVRGQRYLSRFLVNLRAVQAQEQEHVKTRMHSASEVVSSNG